MFGKQRESKLWEADFMLNNITVAPSAVQLKLQHRRTTLTQECVECKTTSQPLGTKTVIKDHNPGKSSVNRHLRTYDSSWH